MEIALPAPPLPNTYWALPGLLLAGEHPSGLTPEATRQRLSTLLACGIECFLDLTHPAEIDPYDQALPFHVEYLRKPIRDHGLPERREHMMEILDCLHDALGVRQAGLCALPCRHRPHGHGGRVPAGRARPDR